MRVKGVDNVLVGVGDLDEARRFYGDRLGLPVRFAVGQMALFAIGDEAPGLLVRVGHVADGGSMRVWLEVADARAAGAELVAAGVRLLAEPFEVHTGWTVEVADPWGNVIGLTDYTKRPAMART
ncbi:VOC family protein [Sphaerisporangium corydalis]|uniref:VOC family protein n=1 Tax=Sphaerisporangium corydalis TaxID=1441875 RepID=A0ABV9ER77_9ACTN|nr:VOC family protein [Sphaerisporangium corydalis]